MKSILVILILATSVSLFSQQTTTTVINTDYLKKGKHQKVAAWSLLGGGVVMGSIGSVIATKEVAKIGVFPFPGMVEPDEKKLNGGAVLIVIGGAAILSSIPLFIAASRNKTKAASVSFKMERTPIYQQRSFVYHSYPALSLKIPIQ